MMHNFGPALVSLDRVKVGCVTDVSEEHTASSSGLN
jgi:hypothetical protein